MWPALLVAASTLSAFQAKPVLLTGVWTGALTRSDGSSGLSRPETEDADVTGSAGPDTDRQSAIAHGKVETVKGVTTVTFDATQQNGSASAMAHPQAGGGRKADR